MSLNYDVLVVNDRMLDAHETLVALEQVAPRAAVLQLDSGREALEYLFSVGAFAGRPPLMPQLVLLSADMSDISGLCILDLVRAHPLTCNLPIVLLSLEGDPRKFRRHDSFDADAYVIKPSDFQRYCAIMQGCVRCWIPSALRPSGCGDSRPQRVAPAHQVSLSHRLRLRLRRLFRQRNKFLIVVDRQLNAASAPIRLGLLDALLTQRTKVPPDVARAHRLAIEHHHDRPFRCGDR